MCARLMLAPLLALSLAPAPAAAQEVVVSAASSLADVLTEIGRVWEARTGERVAVNVAGSNTLARQIRAGAPVDLFISADRAQIDAVAGELADAPIALLGNQLVVAVPRAGAVTLDGIEGLTAPRFRRIAMGDPAAVPAGVYARQHLEAAGLWDALAPRVVPTGSVRLALAAVETGAVDAAIVYRTDVGASDRAVVALEVPPPPDVRYLAAVVRGGDNLAGGRRLLAFLRGPEARAIFLRAGFRPLGDATGER